VTTPIRPVPVETPKALAALGRQWEALKLAVPAPPAAEVPPADVLASARVEPQAAESRAALPRFGLPPDGQTLTLTPPPGWTGPAEKLTSALHSVGLKGSGVPPAPLTLTGTKGPATASRVELYAVARVSLSPPDARGRTVPQIDHFAVATACPCGQKDCPFNR
jgi:hypothetical protein